MHCFGIVPKLIKTPVDLLKMLLSLHSRQVRLPTFLAEYLIESLAREPSLHEVAARRDPARAGRLSEVPPRANGQPS